MLCISRKTDVKEEFDTAYTRLQEMNREHNSNTSVKQIINQEIEE